LEVEGVDDVVRVLLEADVGFQADAGFRALLVRSAVLMEYELRELTVVAGAVAARAIGVATL